MTLIEREAGRTVFGADAQGYADARPDYPARVYDILRQTCGAGPDRQVFEIGAGTGLATGHLVEAGCAVTAIEPDWRLAAVLQERIGHKSSRLKLVEETFENANLLDQAFDLGIAAMSLHWLDPRAALQKAWRLLRPGGHWAMWWTEFGDPYRIDEFHRKTLFLFDELESSPAQGADSRTSFALEESARTSELHEAGFRSIAFETIRWSPVFDKKQVLALTATFSPVARLGEAAKGSFLEKLGRVIDDDFGGVVTRNFVTAVYTAVRPHT
jgi:SAM-dependent methyltransferase